MVEAIMVRGAQLNSISLNSGVDDVFGILGLIGVLVFGGTGGFALSAELARRRRVHAMESLLGTGSIVSQNVPSESVNRIGNPSTYWDAVLGVVRILYSKGHFDECITMLANAPEVYRTLFPSPAPALEAQDFLSLARLLLQCGNVAKAEADIAAALTLDPAGAASEAAVLRAQCALAEDRLQDALTDIAAWSAKYPDKATPTAVLAHLTGAEAALRSGDAATAAAYLSPLLAQQDGKSPIPNDAYAEALGKESVPIKALKAEIAVLRGDADGGNEIVLALDGMKILAPDPVVTAGLIMSQIRWDMRKGSWKYALDNFTKLAKVPLTAPLRREAGTLVDDCMKAMQSAGKDTSSLAPFARAFAPQSAGPA